MIHNFLWRLVDRIVISLYSRLLTSSVRTNYNFDYFLRKQTVIDIA